MVTRSQNVSGNSFISIVSRTLFFLSRILSALLSSIPRKMAHRRDRIHKANPKM